MANKNFKPRRSNKSKLNQGRNSQPGKRPNSKGKKYQSTDEVAETDVKPSMKHPSAKNDASWYTYSTDIVRVAANINYNNPIGEPYHMQAHPISADTSVNETAPALMGIYWTPSPGMAQDNAVHRSVNAPVNLQMRSLYSLIQATVTQNLPFAAADLGIHLMFMDTIFLFMAHMQRFYYLYRAYKLMNRSMPDIYYEAYGLHPQSLVVDGYTIADFEKDLLELEQELERIFVPEGFDILNRHYWMGKHVFKDSDSVKAQQYMFIPKYVWAFDGDGSLTGGQLVLTPVPNFYNTGMKGMMDFFHNLLDNFYSDADVSALNGYLMRAFDKRWIPDALDINGILEPTFEPEVLLQIHNMRSLGPMALTTDLPDDPTAGVIYQTSKDTIAWNPMILQGSRPLGASRGDVFIDMPMDAPTLSDNMVATRLTVSGYSYLHGGEGGTMVFKPLAYGTELVNWITIYSTTHSSDSSGASNSIQMITSKVLSYSIYDEGHEGLITYHNDFFLMSWLSHFGFGPLLSFTNDSTDLSDINDGTWIDFLGDITNYTVISSKDLMKMHDAAALGEWLVKQ